MVNKIKELIINYPEENNIEYMLLEIIEIIKNTSIKSQQTILNVLQQSNIQIYNRALNAVEVLQNYNASKGRFGL